MKTKFDFSGWATRANLKCSDGVTILRDAFKINDGDVVPLIWNHDHTDSKNVLGHALLENRPEGIYAYGSFNDTESGKNAKLLVQNGDIDAMSIWASGLTRNGDNIVHGVIKELSLVIAGANPGAFIDTVLAHGESSETEARIFTGENILCHFDEEEEEEDEEDPDNTEEEILSHADDEKTVGDVFNTFTDEQKQVVYAMITHALEEGANFSDEESDELDHADHSGKTAKEIYEALTDEQKEAAQTMIGEALQHSVGNPNNNNPEGGDNSMKVNLFDKDTKKEEGVLSHSDGMQIIEKAKTGGMTLKAAMKAYITENKADVLKHGFDDIDTLFPEYQDVRPGAPELITRDQGWVSSVMSKTHKSPISRIRTRQMDIRPDNIRAHGYVKGDQKIVPPNAKMLKRTTDPQTVYRKDALNRDDIVDITDFDVVEYQYGIMRLNLNEELARAIMIGDGRDDGDEQKIDETHIRSIWHDDELYTIHKDIDFDATKAELQGGDTSKYFGTNFITAEAIVTAALYAREEYKGSGSLDLYCEPHLLNVMLLSKDRDGRRIYRSVEDVAMALNVQNIYTVEQFANKTRTSGTGVNTKTKKLLGIFVNLADYQIGSTKGGEITRFNQFDIDFNLEKYLIETRVSGALTRIKSAIVLEEDVTENPNP